MEKLFELTSKMLEFTAEIHSYKRYKKKVKEELEKNKDNPEAIKGILKGKTRQEVMDSYNLYILQLLSYLDYYNQEIALYVGGPKALPSKKVEVLSPLKQEKPIEIKPLEVKEKKQLFGLFKKKEVLVNPVKQVKPILQQSPLEKQKTPIVQTIKQPVLPPVVITSNSMGLKQIDVKTKKRYLAELGIDEYSLKKFKNKKPIEEIEDQEFSVYEANFYGKLCNSFFEKTTMSLTKNPGKLFGNLKYGLIQADVRILSKTYISMLIFSSFLALFLSFFITFFLSYFSGGLIINTLMLSLLVSIIIFCMTAVIFYSYPFMLINSRARAIKNDLPFVIIHMAAVAGSGASPISMFHLILTTGEYKGMEREIKKILNYVNLFGYDLSSALRAVSITTPSKPFKDLLNGIISTVESGGNLSGYLKGKADDAMNNYKLERKKYVESLSTYSDIYTGVLIAAPLLFIVTLAIINLLGGEISGISVASIATIGTYGILPLLNLFFILFLNIIQPEV